MEEAELLIAATILSTFWLATDQRLLATRNLRYAGSVGGLKGCRISSGPNAAQLLALEPEDF